METLTWLLATWLLGATHIVFTSCTKTTLNIGGFYEIAPISGGWNGAGCLPAAQMAIEHINNMKDILTDYHISMQVFVDSKCDAAPAIRGMVDYITGNQTTIAFLGPGCSSGTIPVAGTAHFWNIIEVSYGAASPILSNTDRFPLFFRTYPSENLHNAARIALLKQFGWTRIGILRDMSPVSIAVTEKLLTELRDAGIETVTVESFTDTPVQSVRLLKDKDVRIIITFMYVYQHRVAMCEAYKLKLYGPRHVWIIYGWYETQWWNIEDNSTDCTPAEFETAAGNYLSINVKSQGYNSTLMTSMNKTVNELWNEYTTRAKASPYSWNEFAGFSYDATWSVALMLNKSIASLSEKNLYLENFTYDSVEMSTIFKNIMANLSFYGMSGAVSFDSQGDRVDVSYIKQRQGDEEIDVGYYDTTTGKIQLLPGREFVWQGGVAPRDSVLEVERFEGINLGIFIAISSISIIGIIMAISFLIFNVRHRHMRFIKMSSPRMNNLIVIGCVFIYLSTIVIGLDRNIVPSNWMDSMCQLEAWMLCIGFSLAFGAMFSKTWRVHRIFLNKLERKVIKDSRLVGTVCILLFIDVIVLTTWQIADPMEVTRFNLTTEINQEEDTMTIPFVEACFSTHHDIWRGIIFGYKGLLLLYGTSLAWETRHVTIPALNDSKHIGIAVYNVIVLCIIAISVTMLVKDKPGAIFVFVTVLMIFCTSLTLCLVFVPKIIHYRKDPAGEYETRLQFTENGKGVGVRVFPQQRPASGVRSPNLTPIQFKNEPEPSCSSTGRDDIAVTVTSGNNQTPTHNGEVSPGISASEDENIVSKT